MSDELSRVMRSSAEGLHPNVGMLTAGGLVRGKRKRRMRRTGQVVGSAASVTAVFGAVALLGTHGSGGSAPIVSAAASGTSPNPVTPTTGGAQAPSSAPSSASSAPPVSAEQMVDALKQALAPYHFTSEDSMYSGGTGDGTGGAFATFKVKWAAGTGTISINVVRGTYDPKSNVVGVPYWTETKLQDGSVLDFFDGPENPAGNGFAGENTYSGALYRTDGVEIQFQTTNSPDEKAAPSAATQPVTKDQLKQVIQAPAWDAAIAAVKAEPDPAQKAKMNTPAPPSSWPSGQIVTSASRSSAH